MLRSTPLLLTTLSLLLASSLAHAQYSWIDEKGVRQFSDRPPPPSTPPHRILKSPGRALPQPAAAAKPQDAAPAPSRELKTLAEREAAYLARRKLREEQDKKDADQVQRQRDLAEHCQAARDTKAQVESGIRIAKFEASGERSFLSDEERAAQLARANKALQECR